MLTNYAGSTPIDGRRADLKKSANVWPRRLSTRPREWIAAVSITVLIVALVALIGLAALSQVDTTEFVRLDFVSRGW
jgi:hypothetical protein